MAAEDEALNPETPDAGELAGAAEPAKPVTTDVSVAPSSAAIAARVVIGCSAIVAWLVLFTFGISVGTNRYLQALNPDDPQNQQPTVQCTICFRK